MRFPLYFFGYPELTKAGSISRIGFSGTGGRGARGEGPKGAPFVRALILATGFRNYPQIVWVTGHGEPIYSRLIKGDGNETSSGRSVMRRATWSIRSIA